MPADARGAFNLEADGDGATALRRKIDVLAPCDLGRTIIVQRQEVDLIRHDRFGDWHGGESLEEEPPAAANKYHGGGIAQMPNRDRFSRAKRTPPRDSDL